MITVVTVCYNAADDLEKTILSVLKQKECEVEYIIKDGGSTDHTEEIIRKYREKLEQLCVFHYLSAPDGGIYDAMNAGIRLATGKRILFLNSGDVLYDESVLACVDGAAMDADIIYGNIVARSEGKQILQIPDLEANYETWGKHMSCCHQAAFIRTDVMKEYLYDTKYRYCADYDFFVKMARFGKTYRYIDKTIVVFALGGLSYTRAFDLLEETYRIRLEHGCISEIEYNRLSTRNKLKRFSRKLIPPMVYECLKKWKRRHDHKNWDEIK